MCAVFAWGWGVTVISLICRGLLWAMPHSFLRHTLLTDASSTPEGAVRSPADHIRGRDNNEMGGGGAQGGLSLLIVGLRLRS